MFIPDFFSTGNASRAGRAAAAETLIAKGRRKRMPPLAPEAWLFERFGVARQRDWPVAPYTLLADGGAPERHFWIRADPVNLSAGRNSLAFDASELEISRAEADALVGSLNRHFGDTLAFQAPHPERWYVRLPADPDMETAPPAGRGLAVERRLPSGAGAMRFHALMNEAQMLLHEHAVNTEREARGAPPVNSVWFWGGGVLGSPQSRPFSVVASGEPLARGLALAAGTPALVLPGNAGALLAALPAEGRALIALDSQRLPALERDWFEPLLAALASGRIGMLTLHLAGPDSLLQAETVRSDLRHFWRTRKPLETYLA